MTAMGVISASDIKKRKTQAEKIQEYKEKIAVGTKFEAIFIAKTNELYHAGCVYRCYMEASTVFVCAKGLTRGGHRYAIDDFFGMFTPRVKKGQK